MLDLSFLRNPRFGVASTAISLASFALFGASFACTQFLQDALGYSALQAGAAMVPLAVGLMAGAATSVKLVPRLGVRGVVTIGLVGLAATMLACLGWSPDMPYWPLGLWFFAVAWSMGFVMSPATASVMGSVPSDKAGVASAMNDVTREVGGALGTAVLGSLISSLYASRVAGSVTHLPAAVQDQAKDSIGMANAVAAHLGGTQGAQVRDAAASAFTEALGLGLAIAAACAVAAAVAVRLWLPSDAGAGAAEPIAGALPQPA